jgi:hypothetical protein
MMIVKVSVAFFYSEIRSNFFLVQKVLLKMSDVFRQRKE